ncbi:MAG TPA: hypothetical protein VF138_10210 [Caulobacteraceae bacterium]
MWLTRIFVLVGAAALIGFFAWPMLSDLNMDGEIAVKAGGFSAHIPAVIGVFGTLGLAAMLFAVKR